MRSKDKIFDKFQKFKAKFKIEIGNKNLIIFIDRRRKYLSHTFNNFLIDDNIKK